MSRELDIRNFSVDQSSQPRLEELELQATAVLQLFSSDHVVVVTDVDPTTGNAARIVSTDSSAGEADFVQRALDHVQAVSPALGLTSRGREFVADPHALKTSAGGRSIYSRPTRGSPFSRAPRPFRFEPDGRIGDIVGSTIEISTAAQVTTRLSVHDAVLRAAVHVAEPDDDERGATDQFGQPLTPTTVGSTNRHTAFDSSVVFHEYAHGMTNRLVGGRINTRALDSIQSRGMGEGWSDYLACMLTNSTVIGAWVVDNPAGIRGFPYDSAFPDGFGQLGTGRYLKVHNIGEIWCATLMEISRQIDRSLALQIVIDALKLTPPTSSRSTTPWQPT